MCSLRMPVLNMGQITFTRRRLRVMDHEKKNAKSIFSLRHLSREQSCCMIKDKKECGETGVGERNVGCT